ncbi:hydroxymethylglutaryl-CoA lyase [Rhodococcus sp. NPDC060086]|uniref:hydroxymethylglutaryl-CoA lyase n=1 Tax=Rhodococcus sp. NPDC060086 TaxID=3347055 RepID=UPI00366A1FAF
MGNTEPPKTRDTASPEPPSSAVTIVEVSPRDGLQNEETPLPTETKLELIGHLVAAGLRRIEATSFVHPERVPQMADAEAVAAELPRGEVSWIGLVLNERGLDRAIAAGLDEVNIVVVASDTFSRRNQGTSTDEGVALWSRLAKRASNSGLRTTVTIAAAFGCPFEGEVPVERVANLVRRCSDVQPDELALADTIGVGVPAQVVALADAAQREAPGVPLRWHFHNTRNTGYANALTALQLGASALDASLGGIGGCPFAPAATGNIATEDLWYLLDRSGYATGVDPSILLDSARRLGEMLDTKVSGQLSRAGRFPPAELVPDRRSTRQWLTAR